MSKPNSKKSSSTPPDVDADESLIRQQELIAWASALSGTWDFFATMTFRHPQTPMDATMKLRSWISSFPAKGKRLLQCLYAVEAHQSGNAHIHALLAFSSRPLIGHCRRCAHEDDGSCRRVQVTCLDKDFSTYQRAMSHGASVNDPLWKQLNESWFCHFGMARFRPYDATLKFGAVAYVMKYVFKNADLMEWGYLDAEDFK